MLATVINYYWCKLLHTATRDLPTVMDTPEAVVQQQRDFGDATDFGSLSVERMRFAAGTDVSPLLEGLPDDLCQCPHWGDRTATAIATATGAESKEDRTAQHREGHVLPNRLRWLLQFVARLVHRRGHAPTSLRSRRSRRSRRPRAKLGGPRGAASARRRL